MDPERVLRPLDEAESAIRALSEYGSREELAEAVRVVDGAVDRSLRLLLRSHVAVPPDLRLKALSETELPRPQLLEAVRARDLISLELAGTVHQLRQLAERGAQAPLGPDAADVALTAVSRLRQEVRAHSPAELEPAPQGSEPEIPVEVAPERRNRWIAYVAAAVALLVLVTLALVLVRGVDRSYGEAVEAFRDGRLGVAEQGFREVVREHPRNVSALLYLARIYRREARFREAADALERAVALEPRDDDVRRELGHLFLDLERPTNAADQYRRALEIEPNEPRNWAGLIRALRATGDPRAADLLRDAPAEVREALAPAD